MVTCIIGSDGYIEVTISIQVNTKNRKKKIEKDEYSPYHYKLK